MTKEEEGALNRWAAAMRRAHEAGLAPDAALKVLAEVMAGFLVRDVAPEAWPAVVAEAMDLVLVRAAQLASTHQSPQ